jgi:hypothetical protein
MWIPITLEELNSMMLDDETLMDEQELRLWDIIRITPQKWSEDGYGKKGGGFWVVGIIGSQVVWYNDIEDGFNISSYSSFGKIDEYVCNQDELWFTIKKLIQLIDKGKSSLSRGGPKPLNFK